MRIQHLCKKFCLIISTVVHKLYGVVLQETPRLKGSLKRPWDDDKKRFIPQIIHTHKRLLGQTDHRAIYMSSRTLIRLKDSFVTKLFSLSVLSYLNSQYTAICCFLYLLYLRLLFFYLFWLFLCSSIILSFLFICIFLHTNEYNWRSICGHQF